MLQVCTISISINPLLHLLYEAIPTSIRPYVVFFCQQMDALPLLTPSVGSGEDVASTTVLTQEAAQKLQLLERERDSLKVERHMYQMKWLATEDMLQTVKDDRQSIQVPIQLYTLVK